METRLVMYFKTARGSRCSVSVIDPKDDVTEQEIKDLMDLIVTKNIFKINNFSLTEALEAKIVQTDIVEYDLVV